MKRALMSAVAIAFLLMLPELLAAQDLTSSIVGTWKLTSFARKEVATGKTAALYGEHPTGYAYYTKGGHFLIFAVAQDRKKNEEIAAPTDAERIELFKSMFASGGIYKIEGNKITFDVDIAWVQSWVGTTRTYQVEMANCRHVRRASDGVRLLHEGWPLPYLRGGTRPQNERKDSGPHGRGTY